MLIENFLVFVTAWFRYQKVSIYVPAVTFIALVHCNSKLRERNSTLFFLDHKTCARTVSFIHWYNNTCTVLIIHLLNGLIYTNYRKLLHSLLYLAWRFHLGNRIGIYGSKCIALWVLRLIYHLYSKMTIIWMQG